MLKNNFCSSPWFHLRLSPEGNYRPCRWGDYEIKSNHHISNTSLSEYLNSNIMSEIRNTMLAGEVPPLCTDCHYESSHGKLSGRQRQLLKSAIVETNFTKTFCASPHWDHFLYSHLNNGQTLNHPVDLQIDLGNTCNSACIMCLPRYSTKVIDDHIKLHKISPQLFPPPEKIVSWTNDPNLVTKFIDDISTLNGVKYIHFLGGETLYIKSFYDICNKLIDQGLAKDIIIGTTTNCTVYDDRIEHIIKNFKQVHLGLSIETITDLNDYIRWPSKIEQVKSIINKFLQLRKTSNLFISLRITPNIFTIYQLDGLLEFMIENHITAESCNILYHPSCLRMELIPDNIKLEIIDKFDQLIAKFNLSRANELIINRRREDLKDPVISSVVFEYRDFLANFKEPTNLEEERHSLVKFLKSYEIIHNNCILDYLPEYEEFLRSYGY